MEVVHSEPANLKDGMVLCPYCADEQKHINEFSGSGLFRCDECYGLYSIDQNVFNTLYEQEDENLKANVELLKTKVENLEKRVKKLEKELGVKL